MSYTLWYSTESAARYLVARTTLREREVRFRKLDISDASASSRFHAVPTHLKQILYLDSPDLILERDGKPILALEFSSEAGTGHNVFQRFARIAAAAENGVPCFYVYPAGVRVVRQDGPARFDRINPLIYKALEQLMRFFGVPAFLLHHPGAADGGRKPDAARENKGLWYDPEFPAMPLSSDPQMRRMFALTDALLSACEATGRVPAGMLNEPLFQAQRDDQLGRISPDWEGQSPLSACQLVSTERLLEYVRGKFAPGHQFGDLLPSRPETLVYTINAKFRGDPYPGALAAIDYLRARTREGKSFEDRSCNLAMAWGDFSRAPAGDIRLARGKGCSVEDYMQRVRGVYADDRRVLLGRKYRELKPEEVSRYFMQVRFGTAFTKPKEVRILAYFADLLLFPDGALWREG